MGELSFVFLILALGIPKPSRRSAALKIKYGADYYLFSKILQHPQASTLSAEGQIVYTVGHSNRELAVFLDLLREFHVTLLVDIRRFPVSKWGWFRRENLEKALEDKGIRYTYLGDLLGGFRKGGYPQYMNTKDFHRGVETLVSLSRTSKVAIMCAERIVFKCHRRYIARHLQELGFRVVHIVDPGKSFESQAPSLEP